MAVYDSTNVKNTRTLLSQTPPNYVPENYYMKELQQKINADWPYRPNRFDIEKEFVMGSEVYEPIQVVLQSVKNDKGTEVADDWMRVVYKDIYQNTHIGERFRFSQDLDHRAPVENRSIWLAVNHDGVNQTSSQVIRRCNGTIIGLYTDENGVKTYHEEPVVQGDKLTTTTFQYNEVAIDPKGQLTILAQYNKYTKQWYINQRFVIGTNTVYKVANIIANDSETTYNPEDVGVIKVYLDIDQIGKRDDFVKRIAYNGDPDQPIGDVENAHTDVNERVIKILDAADQQINVPDILMQTFEFKPALFINGVISGDIVNVDFTLTGAYADMATLSDFVDITESNGIYTLRKIANDPGLILHIVCHEGETELAFDMKLNGWA